MEYAVALRKRQKIAIIMSFIMTITVLIKEDLDVPKIKRMETAERIATAGRLKKPWAIVPLASWTVSKGEADKRGSIPMCHVAKKETTYPDQLTATVEAPTAYSKISAQPIIHAINSPIAT